MDKALLAGSGDICPEIQAGLCKPKGHYRERRAAPSLLRRFWSLRIEKCDFLRRNHSYWRLQKWQFTITDWILFIIQY